MVEHECLSGRRSCAAVRRDVESVVLGPQTPRLGAVARALGHRGYPERPDGAERLRGVRGDPRPDRRQGAGDQADPDRLKRRPTRRRSVGGHDERPTERWHGTGADVKGTMSAGTDAMKKWWAA